MLDKNATIKPDDSGRTTYTYIDKSEAIHKGALGHDVALWVGAFIKRDSITSETEAVEAYIRMKKMVYEKDKTV